MFNGLDHIAILVGDTDEALRLYRDQLGLPVLLSEVVNQGAIRLTHLDLGNTQLQLVQPLAADHPLQAVLREKGSCLHHFCFSVDNVDTASGAVQARGIGLAQVSPHQGTLGKRALFLDRATTGGIQLELTGE